MRRLAAFPPWKGRTSATLFPPKTWREKEAPGRACNPKRGGGNWLQAPPCRGPQSSAPDIKAATASAHRHACRPCSPPPNRLQAVEPGGSFSASSCQQRGCAGPTPSWEGPVGRNHPPGRRREAVFHPGGHGLHLLSVVRAENETRLQVAGRCGGDPEGAVDLEGGNVLGPAPGAAEGDPVDLEGPARQLAVHLLDAVGGKAGLEAECGRVVAAPIRILGGSDQGLARERAEGNSRRRMRGTRILSFAFPGGASGRSSGPHFLVFTGADGTQG